MLEPFFGWKKDIIKLQGILLETVHKYEGHYPCVCCRLPIGPKGSRGVCSGCRLSIENIAYRDSFSTSKYAAEARHKRVLVDSFLYEISTLGEKDTFLSSWKEIDSNKVQHVKEYSRDSPGFYLGNYKWDKMIDKVKQCIFPKLDINGYVIE